MGDTAIAEKPEIEVIADDEQPEGTMTQSLQDEIDAEVDSVVATADAARAEKTATAKADEEVPTEPGEIPPAKKDDLPPSKKQEGDEDDDAESTGAEGDEPGVITDEHLERAVKVGMTITDAKTFQDAKALDNVISILEAKAKPEGESHVTETDDDEDPLSGIPELDPEVYDDKLIAVVESLKAIIGGQHKTIKGMKSESEARAGSWFDGQVDSLGKDIGDALREQPAKRAELKDKFDVLSAGYKAAEKDVGNDVVLKEAIAVVLGDVVAKAAATVKTEKLKKRGALHVSRPGGLTPKPSSDAFSDVAGELDQKYFDKK